MSVVIREGSVPLPAEWLQEHGIHEGSELEWKRGDDGSLNLRPLRTRSEIARSLLGAGRRFLKPGESGVDEFLKWRQEEREMDETY